MVAHVNNRRTSRRRKLLVLLASLLMAGGSTSAAPVQSPAQAPAQAPAQRTAQAAPQSTASAVNFNVTQSVETLKMIVSTSRLLTFDKPIPKFQVHNLRLLSANPMSQNQIQVSALSTGMTQMDVWDAEGTSYRIDVIISADAREVEGILASQFPGSSLKVTALANGAVLSGTVNNVDDVDRAVQIVEQFYAQVVTNVRVVGVQQIMLHTKIMEVSRTKFRELGVDWALVDRTNATGVLFGAGGLINAPATNFTGAAQAGLQTNTRIAADIGRYDLDVLVRALRQNDLIKVLAEPTVVATHGRPSRFIVGGQVPYIVPTGNGSISIQYEEFGTSVDFLPFVVGPGRIRLEVRPEVSEPDPSRAVVLQGATIPAFRQRYVETAVEMNAGQTFAIAGLLSNRVEATTRATPFFGELPWVGSLFRRISEQNNEIELLITVRPELAEAMDPYQVPPGGPGLNTQSPSDKELYLRGYLEVPRTDGMCPAPGMVDAEEALPWDGCPPGQGASGEYAPGMLEYPTGQITPHSSPTPVGPGVLIVSPKD